jgi:hypothetical protein
MTELATELSKPEYAGLSNAERFALLQSKTEQVLGKIAYGNTLHLVSMLARGLRLRIDTCAIAALKYAWNEALNPAYLSSPSYSINVALPEIRGMLDQGKAAGICTQDEYDFIIQLATYSKQSFPSATIKDVVAHFNPELIGGEWHELEPTTARKLKLRLATRAPTATHVVIQAQDVYGDGSVSDWFHATAAHGIELAREYPIEVPQGDYPRRFRWSCEYALDCVVSA